MKPTQQQSVLKTSQPQSLSDIGISYYATAPNRYLERKVCFQEKINFNYQKKKIPTIEPLTFSSNFGIKKRQHYSREVSLRSKNSFSNKGSCLNSSNSGSQIGGGYLFIKKQNQQLKTQQAHLFSRLLQSRKAYQQLNKNYIQKCQETETLKSIINSLRTYIHQQLVQNVQNSQEGSNNSLQHQQQSVAVKRMSAEQKRRLSQLNSIKRVSINFNGLLNQVPQKLKADIQTKFDSYLRHHCAESIKGSAYEIYSFNEMI